MENEVYPENTLLVLENQNINPCEVGFSQSEDNIIIPLSYDERNSYCEELSSYAQIFVIDNNLEVFENHLTSMQSIKGEESTVLGLYLS
jgi:hypothetical protein